MTERALSMTLRQLLNIVEKSILAAIRNIKFFTLDELNDEIWQRVDKINAASFQLTI